MGTGLKRSADGEEGQEGCANGRSGGNIARNGMGSSHSGLSIRGHDENAKGDSNVDRERCERYWVIVEVRYVLEHGHFTTGGMPSLFRLAAGPSYT